MRFLNIFLVILVLFSCANNKDTESTVSENETLFSLLPSEHTGIDFVNKVENQKNFNIF